MNTTTKFLLGFVVGALTGATIGLLLAPDKGEETRRILSEKIDELTKKGKEIYESKKKQPPVE